VNNNEKSGWLVILIFFGSLLLLGVLAISKVRIRPPPQGVCIAHMRQLSRAKEQWRETNQETNGATITTNDLISLLDRKRMPVCPEGGTYALGRVGEPPTCTVPGHSLP
jgi:hypothetical protein